MSSFDPIDPGPILRMTTRTNTHLHTAEVLHVHRGGLKQVFREVLDRTIFRDIRVVPTLLQQECVSVLDTPFQEQLAALDPHHTIDHLDTGTAPVILDEQVRTARDFPIALHRLVDWNSQDLANRRLDVTYSFVIC